jgi:hypothetical protein
MTITYLDLKGKFNDKTKKNKIKRRNKRSNKTKRNKKQSNKTKKSKTNKPKPFSGPSNLYRYYSITPPRFY